MSATSPTVDLHPDEPDLRRTDVANFAGRLPDPGELLRWGGQPGVEYLMIDSRNLHDATQLPAVVRNGKSHKWVICRDVPIYTVSGPAGSTTIMVLGRGEPITGADPANGIREWFYDRTILTATGLKAPYDGAVLPTPNAKPRKD